MKKCKKCGNTSFNKHGECEYCVWKGDAGPGKLLREIIRSERRNGKRKTD